MHEQICTKCNVLKPIEQFSLRGTGVNNFKALKAIGWTLHKASCKECDAEYAREFRKKNPGYRGSGRNKKCSGEDRYLLSAIRVRFNSCMSRQRKFKKQIETNLTEDYLFDLFKKQEGKCKYSKELMAIDTKNLLALSLDKIIPDLGYVIGNVQWVCWAVNRAKGELKESDFLAMCRVITERCNDHPVRE